MKVYQLCLLASLALFANTAQATLIGQSIECDADGFFSLCNPTSAVIGSGIEFDIESVVSNYHWSLDIGVNSITFQDLSSGGSSGGHGQVYLTGFDFNDIIGIEGFFTDVSSGIEVSDISFTSNSITIDARNTYWSPLQFLSFNVVTSSSSIPEPASIVLLGLGLFGIGFSRKNKEV